MELAILFSKVFLLGLIAFGPLLLLLVLSLVVLGLVVGRIEGWSRFEAVYWCLITGTTVGYGDYRPTKQSTRIISFLVALVGLMFTGIMVAIAVQAATIGFAELGFADKYKSFFD